MRAKPYNSQQQENLPKFENGTIHHFVVVHDHFFGFLHHFTMVFVTSSHHRRHNPYLRSHAKNDAVQQGKNGRISNNCNNQQVTMGIQSQFRDGSISKCRQWGTRIKHSMRQLVQRGIDRDRGFVQIEHCKVCKALYMRIKGKNVNIPHRSHHRACPRNRKTKGLSERSIVVNRTAAANIAANTAPIGRNSAADAQFREKFGSVFFLAMI